MVAEAYDDIIDVERQGDDSRSGASAPRAVRQG